MKLVNFEQYLKRLTNTVTPIPTAPVTLEEMSANCKRLELLERRRIIDFRKTKYAKMATVRTVVQEMRKDGYRQISRTFRHVARVDITAAEMQEFFVTANFGDRNSGIPCLPVEAQKDQYRRVHSADKIENVPEEIMKHLR